MEYPRRGESVIVLDQFLANWRTHRPMTKVYHHLALFDLPTIRYLAAELVRNSVSSPTSSRFIFIPLEITAACKPGREIFPRIRNSVVVRQSFHSFASLFGCHTFPKPSRTANSVIAQWQWKFKLVQLRKKERKSFLNAIVYLREILLILRQKFKLQRIVFVTNTLKTFTV